jgi:hypothetical protein
MEVLFDIQPEPLAEDAVAADDAVAGPMAGNR